MRRRLVGRHVPVHPQPGLPRGQLRLWLLCRQVRPGSVRDSTRGGRSVDSVCVGRYGRKLSFLLSNILNGVAGIVMAVVPNYSSVLVMRVILGFGVKGGWMTSYVLREDEFADCCRSHFSSSALFLPPTSDGDRRGGVPADGGNPVPDVLQRGHPHPPSAGLLHRRLALVAGGHLGPLPALHRLLLVRKSALWTLRFRLSAVLEPLVVLHFLFILARQDLGEHCSLNVGIIAKNDLFCLPEARPRVAQVAHLPEQTRRSPEDHGSHGEGKQEGTVQEVQGRVATEFIG